MTPRPNADLVAHLVRSTPLSEGEADNDQIFAAIATELPERVFPAPPLSSRQLRRLVYG